MGKVFDLSSFADRLRQDPQHRRLVALIDRWAHRNSRGVDIDHARQLLKDIAWIRTQKPQLRELSGQDDLPGNLEGALFAHAVILYVRATVDGDKGRKYGLDVKPLLSEQQLLVHERIVALRKTTIAHFDEEDRQTWNRDRVVLVDHGEDGWEYGVPFSRTLFENELRLAFSELLDDVLPQVRKLLSEENDQLHSALFGALRSGRDVVAHLDASEFDSPAFFASHVAAEQFRKSLGREGGEFSKNIDHSAEKPVRAED